MRRSIEFTWKFSFFFISYRIYNSVKREEKSLTAFFFLSACLDPGTHDKSRMKSGDIFIMVKNEEVIRFSTF